VRGDRATYLVGSRERDEGGDGMAVLVRYTPQGMTAEQYDAVGRQLEEAGHWPPDGLLAHVGFRSENGVHVSEVWESRGQQERFAEALMPIVGAQGIDLETEPQYLEVHGYLFREASSESGD
jgi:hypothetical protein